MPTLLDAVSDLDHLDRAWRDVRASARRSQWSHLPAEVAAFEAAPWRALHALQQQLRREQFRFSPKRGYAKRKSGGSRRGITVHSLADRLVQRAILNLLQSTQPAIRAQLGEVAAQLASPTSFAGAPGRGVPEAVFSAHCAMRAGARAFATSDIKEFFPYVPRQEVLDFCAAHIADAPFMRLFRAALETELANPEELTPWLDLFPVGPRGVAQGSLLSVLVANLALRRFDARLNQPGLVTIRYLDDFLILGPDRPAVAAAFQTALDELAPLGMTAYSPGDGSHKAFTGDVGEGFDFLGCRLHPDGVSPSRRAGRKLLRELGCLLAAGRRQIEHWAAGSDRRRTEAAYAQTLLRIDHKVRGWGDAYNFVTNRAPFTQLDRKIDRILMEFHHWSFRQMAGNPPALRRRMWGVALLADTPPRRPPLVDHFPSGPRQPEPGEP